MKKFNNNIQDSNEKKIKKGLSLPKDSINLGYYKTQDVTPGTSLVIVDSSPAIRENTIDIENKQVSLIANEFGMLVDPRNGNTRFPTENISITDIRNSELSSSKYVNALEINKTPSGTFSYADYFHSYYVSRFFSPQENIKTTSISKIEYGNRDLVSLEKTLDQQIISRQSNSISIDDIYVTYGDGSPYVDQTGKKKYKIILESYNEKRISEYDKLAKVIVLLEDVSPTNLLLFYPKIEIDSEGNLVNQVLAHSEIINSVPIFTKEGEEASVVDAASRYNKTFSVKSSEPLEDMFSTGGAFDSRGFNIFVNKKAIADNRSYEVFNWRIIGKIRRTVNYANRIDGTDLGSGQNSGFIKAAVIRANTKPSYVNHHKIFGKLNTLNNPINIFNYQFKNPIADAAGIQKTNANDGYWTVDLSSITVEQARSFDFLILVVNNTTDVSAYSEKIRAFVNNGGCLFVEIEGDRIPSSVSALLPSSTTSLSSGVASGVLTYNRTETSPYSEINLKAENQSWDISSSQFDSGYGIYGLISSGLTGTAFPSTLSTNAVVSNNVGPVVIQFKQSATETAGVSAGNIICNTVSINQKAGADYISSTSSDSSGLTTNTIYLSSESEGPIKFFYNCIISGITSKYYTSSNSTNSFAETITLPVIYHATSWKQSWCLNGPVSNDNYSYNDILIKNEDIDEYALYNISREQNGDLYRTVENKSYKEIFLEDFNRSVPSQYAQLYTDTSVDVVSYYVEFTNSTISPKSGTLLDSPLYQGVNTPYKTYQLSSGQELQSPSFKTSTISLPLNVPRDLGQFYIHDRYRSVENRVSNQPNIIGDNLYNYSYDFKTKWRKVVSSEDSLSLDLSHNVNFTIQIPIEYTAQQSNTPGGEESNNNRGQGEALIQWEFSQETYAKESASTNYKDSVAGAVGISLAAPYAVKQDLVDYAKGHNFTIAGYKDEWNHFPYTGDIDITGENRQYSVRSDDLQEGDYVHYIQCTMVADGASIQRDGTFGTKTDKAVRNFQTKYKLGIVDGQVDSQTKSAMAYFWIKQNDIGNLESAKKDIIKHYKSIKKESMADKVIAFIDKAISFADPKSVSNSGAIRLISYTDSKKTPTDIEAEIYLKIPSSVSLTKGIKSIYMSAGRSDFIIESVVLSKDDYDTTGNLATAIKNNKTKSKDLSGNKPLRTPAHDFQEFNLDGIEKTGWKTLILKLRGTKLPEAKYGTARGIFVESIIFICAIDSTTPNLPSNTTVTNPPRTLNDTLYADVYFSKDKNSLTVRNTPVSETITSANIRSYNNLYVTKFYKITPDGQVDISYTESTEKSINIGSILPISQSDYEITKVASYGTIKMKMQQASLYSSAATIDGLVAGASGGTKSASSPFISYISVLSSNLSTQALGLDSNEIFLSYDVNVSSLSSTVNYGGETVVPQHRHLYVSFLSGSQPIAQRVSPNNKNSTNYIDGLVCLCDQNGRPIGFPNFTSGSAGSDSSPVNITNIYLEKNSNFNSSGLIYGFFDLARRKFLGQNLSYAEYEERNGPENIYIAMIATDYDGNTLTDDIDFTGLSPIPVTTLQVPNKIIAPVYNVVFDSNVSIKIVTPSQNMDKRDPWHISVTSGSFTRNMDVNTHILNDTEMSWLKEYYSETSQKISVKAFYDTTSYNNAGWSKILGAPYIDINEEIPKIVDSRTIQLRQSPIATVHEPSDLSDYFSSPIKPFVFIYTKENADANWVKLNFSEIGSFNSNSGIIQFKNPVIPNDERLIKVTYAVKSAAVPIKILDGQKIKINPFIYLNEIKFNKPIYIYMLPRSIQVVGKEPLQRLNNHIYEKDNTLKLTNDSRIFNPTHPKYNPFAVLLSTIYVTDNNFIESLDLKDLRLKGGGISNRAKIAEAITDYPQIRSYWDIMGPDGYAYSQGGYVIVRLPSAVKDYLDDSTIYGTIREALTAGVVFEIQDYSGKKWDKV